jgi:hypothetical protein
MNNMDGPVDVSIGRRTSLATAIRIIQAWGHIEVNSKDDGSVSQK